MKFKILIMQFFKFIIISGVGWLIDFSIYLLLTLKLNCSVGYANFISGIPALTFVFTFSTIKIFKNKFEKISIKKKYCIYFMYQIILMIITSSIAQILHSILLDSELCKFIFINENLKIIIKIIITPITMTLNFCAMKLLTEKY